tara:strand:+ start:1822 stop:2757 length:936 start_codon:yes stop_codon:yes gene_type:complete
MTQVSVVIPLPNSANQPPANPMVNPPTPSINTSGLVVPDKTQYLISSEVRLLLGAIDKMVVQGMNPNILVSGSQGSGKSELPAQYAATRGRYLAVLEIGRLSDSNQIFGYMDLKDGQTVYVKGLFTKAITTPNTVIHLQEINRPENDKSLNAIFSVLDDNQRSIWIDELQSYIQVAPGVTFFASLNEGFEFVGTLPLDEALRNRFHFKLQLQQLPESVEKRLLSDKCGLSFGQISSLMTLVSKLRANTQLPTYISTRDLVYMAKLIKVDLSVELALKSVIGGDTNKMESILLSQHLSGAATHHSEANYDYL